MVTMKIMVGINSWNSFPGAQYNKQMPLRLIGLISLIYFYVKIRREIAI
jgi:hypothetical protein